MPTTPSQTLSIVWLEIGRKIICGKSVGQILHLWKPVLCRQLSWQDLSELEKNILLSASELLDSYYRERIIGKVGLASVLKHNSNYKIVELPYISLPHLTLYLWHGWDKNAMHFYAIPFIWFHHILFLYTLIVISNMFYKIVELHKSEKALSERGRPFHS